MRGALPEPARGGPARPGLPRLPRRAHPRRRGPPRRACCRPSRSASRSCSPRGRCRVVFATETLALGINMPAAVGGDREALEVERRDPRRHHAGGVHPAHRPRRAPRHRRRGPRRGAVAAGAGAEVGGRARLDAHLPAAGRRSARRTTWRSTWCTRSAGPPRASCWSRSFAQFQADKAVVGLARQLRKAEEALDRVRRGGHLPPRRLHGVLRACAAGSPTSRPTWPRHAAPTGATRSSTRWRRCAPGDVIEVPAGPFSRDGGGHRPGHALGPRRPAALRADRRPARAPALDGRLPGAGRGVHPDADPQVASTAATRSRGATSPRRCAPAPRASPRRRPALAATPGGGGRPGRGPGERRGENEITRLRAELRAHPCHGCPDREDHARWAERTTSSSATPARCSGGSSSAPTPSPASSTASARCSPRWATSTDDEVTETGQRLMRIYTDMDLVAAECAAQRALGRALAERARRRPVGAGLRGPPARRRLAPAAARADASSRCSPTWCRCGPTSTRSSASTSSTSCASPTWASPGRPTAGPRAPALDEVLDETDLAAGDFVRWMKQLLDLTDQVARRRRGRRLRRPHAPAAGALRRGVVAYSSVAD